MFATLAGGYPRPADRPARAALAAVLEDQADAGLALLSDGEVHDATTPAADLVAAWGETRRSAAAIAPGLPVKLAVGGPWAAGGAVGAYEIADGLGGALAVLADAGCPVVEVHEPAASLPADGPGRAAFAAAHRTLLGRVADRVHASLAIVGGDATPLGAEALFAAPYRSHLLDVLDGPDGWRLVAAAPAERGIVLGVGDATGRSRTRLEDVAWAASYAASTGGRGLERVGVAPSGSLAGLGREDARAVLALLGEAVAALAAGRDDLLARLDPRAIDARSAALGRYRPPRRRTPDG